MRSVRESAIFEAWSLMPFMFKIGTRGVQSALMHAMVLRAPATGPALARRSLWLHRNHQVIAPPCENPVTCTRLGSTWNEAITRFRRSAALGGSLVRSHVPPVFEAVALGCTTR